MLRLVGLPESTYYDRKKKEGRSVAPVENRRGRKASEHSLTAEGKKISDEQIKEWLSELVAGEEHVYGYRMLAQCLWEQHKLIVNHKKAYRLCKELAILQKQRQKKIKHPRRLARNHTVTGPNQLWQIDIKYGYVAGKDRFIFLLNIIDVFDRVIVGYYRGPSCLAKQVCKTLVTAFKSRQVLPANQPLTVRSDNGPQFLSQLFGDTCESFGIVHERIPPKSPNMNAYIESFHSLLERDLFSKEEYETFDEAYESIDAYYDFYNNRKMHGSLKRKPPAVFSRWVMQLEDRSEFHKTL